MQSDAPQCPICRGTGIASKSPYIMGTSKGDIYTMTACTCAAGRSLGGAKATMETHADALKRLADR